MSVVTLDLASMAFIKDAEEKVAAHLAKSVGSELTTHKWINRSTDITDTLAASVASRILYAYPLESQEAVFSKKRWFYGNAEFAFYVAGVSGQWTIEVAMQNTGLGSDNSIVVNRRLLYVTNVIATPVEGELLRVKIPEVPFLRLAVTMSTGAASGVTIRGDAMFNGLYFETL